MEENAKIVEKEVNDFFEGVKENKHPPPEEKIDPVKAKCTLDSLKRPPLPPPDDNHVRALKKAVEEAHRSGTTSSDKRLQERTSGKEIPQLGEQANQSCPPLKVSSDIVANHPEIFPNTILKITFPTMYIMKSWRWTNTNTITGSLSSNLVILL